MKDPIYLDYNATTPVAPEVIEAMTPALRDLWGNPSSGHVFGRRAQAALDRARSQVASLLGCETDEVVFTSGGTESDNAAILGVAEALADRGRHIVTTIIEHPAVEEPCAHLERRGWKITRVSVDSEGRVDPVEVAAALGAETVLVSVMHANNETGVLQPIREIAALTRPRGIVLHTALVMRTNFYAWGPSYRKSFSDVVIEALRTGHELTLFKDVFYTPILIETATLAAHDLINQKASGIFHVVGDERITKYEFGLKTAKEFNLDSSLINPGFLADHISQVHRPHDMSLSNKKTCDLLGRKLGGVDEHIARLHRQEQNGLTREIQNL